MEEMDTLNGSYSYELTGDKYASHSALTSLKSSLASFFRSSNTPKAKLTKKNKVYEPKKEDYSTEIIDDMDEYCEKKPIANFQKNYLEMGQ